MSSTHYPEERIEDAVAAVLQAECDLGSAVVVKGFDAADIVFPCVSVVCARSRPRDYGNVNPLTNYEHQVDVSVWSDPAQTTRTAHAELCSAVRAVLYADNIVALVNVVAVELTAYQCEPGDVERSVDQNARKTTLSALFLCQPV